MTETQFLTSDNPAEMVAFLGERITDEQRRCFVEACRSSVGSPWSFRKEDLRWTELVYEWVTRAIDNGDISASLAAEILRDIVGNPFRPYWLLNCGGLMRGDVPKGRGHGEHVRIAEIGDWLSWNEGAIPLMVDAMMFEECDKCDGRGWFQEKDYPKWLARCVCDNGRVPRVEPRWSDMLEIADALEEAGCRDQHILEHLRSERDGERCPWCGGGDWGKLGADCCQDCNGTGRIKRRHWRGCWALELLSQKSGSGVGSK